MKAMSILNLTSHQLRQAADLQDKITALEQQLAALAEGESPAPVQSPEPAEEPVKPGKSGKGTRGKRVQGVTGMILKKISDEEIKDFIGGGRAQGDLVKKYGQFIPKRLADMKKAGLVSVRRDGLKKIWSVV